jgi:transcription initiation factor TFIIA large subunit
MGLQEWVVVAIPSQILSSDSEEDEEEEDIENFMCAQFEKVTRTKNRWKIAVREGVFHIHGKGLT